MISIVLWNLYYEVVPEWSNGVDCKSISREFESHPPLKYLFNTLIKLLINNWYKYSPTCDCGYKMKPSNFRGSEEFAWVCVFVKKCGIQAYQTTNGTLHWYKKSCK